MARNEQSSINFNVNINSIEDAQRLAKLLRQIESSFEQIEQHQRKLGEGAGGGGKSWGPGMPKDADRSYVQDRFSDIKLGIRKGDIESVGELKSNYGQLTRVMNKLEDTGTRVNDLRLQAYNLRQKQIKSIQQQRSAISQSTRAKLKSASSTDRMRSQMVSQMGQLNLSTQSVKMAGQAVTNQAGAVKNASYMLLNMGYLIQDSPYGIRGMANNISQLAQSYQMLSQRIMMLNAAQGKNMTVWGQLGKLIKGPTGIILLIGSILPAALEMLSMHWDKLTGAVEGTKDEMEASMEAFNKVLDASIRLRNEFGEDPLGRFQTEAEVQRQEEIVNLKEHEVRLEDALHKAETKRAQGGPPGTDREALAENVEMAEQALEQFREDHPWIPSLDLEKIKEDLKQAKAELKEYADQDENNPLVALEESLSAEAARLQEDLEFFDEAGMKAEMQEVQTTIDSTIRSWSIGRDQAIEQGQMDRAKLFQNYISELRSDDEDDEVDTTMEAVGPYELLTGRSFEDDMSEFLDQVNKLQEARIERKSIYADQAMEDANTTQEKLKANREQYTSEILDIERQRAMGEFENTVQYNNAILQADREFEQQKEEIQRNAAVMEMEMQNMRLEHGMDNPDDYQKQLDRINSYYDRRRRIVKKNVDDELEQQKRLTEIDLQQAQRREQTEQQLQNRKRQLVKNYANFAVNSAQTMGQALHANAKAQFRIQKFASASQAVINGYLAYTKTLAQGGFLAKPLAISALALSLSKAGQIMSQSFDSASATGRTGTAGTSVSYRGLDFASQQRNNLNRPTGSSPFRGTRTGVNNQPSGSKKSGGKETVKMEITDGFDNMVAKGTMELKQRNKSDLGQWVER